jgi:hypothetical protein
MPRGRPKGSKNKPKTAVIRPISAFNRASATKRASMISALTDTLNYKTPMGPRRRPTATQLASLAKARAARASKSATSSARSRTSPTSSIRAVKSAVAAVVSAAAKVKKAASPAQLANLAKAREARIANRGLYAVLPKGGYRSLTSVARKKAREAAYATFSPAEMSGGNTMVAFAPYGSPESLYASRRMYGKAKSD